MPAVLFDFNGVLVDDEELHFEAFREVLGKHGLTLDRARYYAELLGFDDAGLFRAALPGIDDHSLERLIADKARAYAAGCETGLRLFAGARELVVALHERGVHLGVVSGALRREIEGALARFGLADRFDFVVSAEDATRCKPDPLPYLTGLEHLRGRGDARSASECVVIEDSPPGVAAARAAGMKVVAVAHTVAPEALADADLVVPVLPALGADAVLALLQRQTPQGR
jgi:HAD superfamily hydrolase (TIGR01509 family)